MNGRRSVIPLGLAVMNRRSMVPLGLTVMNRRSMVPLGLAVMNRRTMIPLGLTMMNRGSMIPLGVVMIDGSRSMMTAGAVVVHDGRTMVPRRSAVVDVGRPMVARRPMMVHDGRIVTITRLWDVDDALSGVVRGMDTSPAPVAAHPNLSGRVVIWSDPRTVVLDRDPASRPPDPTVLRPRVVAPDPEESGLRRGIGDDVAGGGRRRLIVDVHRLRRFVPDDGIRVDIDRGGAVGEVGRPGHRLCVSGVDSDDRNQCIGDSSANEKRASMVHR